MIGVWEWRDSTNSLEFKSSTNAKSKGKPNVSKPLERVNSAKEQQRSQHSFYSQEITPPSADEVVTLDLIKRVTINVMGENRRMPATFHELLWLPQFDKFLIHLLHYFQCYFKKKEEDSHNTVVLESNKEAKLSEVAIEFEASQKKLAHCYAVLILGIGIPDHHHMKCGSKRVSSSSTDKVLYEALYVYCTFFVWLTFKRTAFPVIQEETERLLRSEVFSSGSRRPQVAETSYSHRAKMKTYSSASKANAAAYKEFLKRPPIMSVINQKSPLLVSLLPSPKEEASWLFEKNSQHYKIPDDIINFDNEEERLTTPDQLGILGEPLMQFNPKTLLPIDSEVDDDAKDTESVDEETKINRSFFITFIIVDCGMFNSSDLPLVPKQRSASRDYHHIGIVALFIRPSSVPFIQNRSSVNNLSDHPLITRASGC